QHMAKNDPSPDVRAHVAFALSVSHEASAIDEMIRMARDDTSAHVRGQALFWLAQKAGQKAVGTITGAIDNDPDTEVKKKAVFALSQLPREEGVPKLIEVAQNNRNREVRKQAMFWLGQSHDPRALQFFEKVLAQWCVSAEDLRAARACPFWNRDISRSRQPAAKVPILRRRHARPRATREPRQLLRE